MTLIVPYKLADTVNGLAKRSSVYLLNSIPSNFTIDAWTYRFTKNKINERVIVQRMPEPLNIHTFYG